MMSCSDDPIVKSQKEIEWVVAAPADPNAPVPWPLSLVFPLAFPAGTFLGAENEEVGPGSLEVTEKAMDTQAALIYLLKILTVENAKHLDKALLFLMTQACPGKFKANIPFQEYYPMEFIHEVRFVGCGFFKLQHEQRVCGNYLKKQQLCSDIPATPPRQR